MNKNFWYDTSINDRIQHQSRVGIRCVNLKFSGDKLKFKDFDKMLTNTVMTGTPVPVERETQILASGTPINTSEGDNHEEHIQAHSQQLNATVQAGQRDQGLAQNESMQRLFGKVLFNLQNHIAEHTALYKKQIADEQMAVTVQQGAANEQTAGA